MRIYERLVATLGRERVELLLRRAASTTFLAIPKAATPAHVRENRAAAEPKLDTETLRRLDGIFPRPSANQPLKML